MRARAASYASIRRGSSAGSAAGRRITWKGVFAAAHLDLTLLGDPGQRGGPARARLPAVGPVPDPAGDRRRRRSASSPGCPTSSWPRRRCWSCSCRRCCTRAAFFSSLRDLRDNVAADRRCWRSGWWSTTTLGVGAIAHAVVDDLSWAAAFTLGAIVAPDRPGRGDRDRARSGRPAAASSRSSRASRSSTTPRALVAYKVARRRDAHGRVLAWSTPATSFVLDPIAGVAIGARRRRGHRRGAPDDRRRADGDHDLPAHAVLRLPAGRGARGQRGAGGGDQRHLPRLARAAP